MSDDLRRASRVQSEPVSEEPEAVHPVLDQQSHIPGSPIGNKLVTPDSLRRELINVLNAHEGFIEHALSDVSVPLYNEESKRLYLGLFLDAARHFMDSTSPKTISDYVDKVASDSFYSQLIGSSEVSHEDRKANVEKLFWSILGTWLGLSSLFRRGAGEKRLRPILLVPDRFEEAAKECDLRITIESLLERSVFIPRHPSRKDLVIPDNINNADEALAIIESTVIDKLSLNTFTLQDYAQVEVRWVNNISRHMVLSNRTGRHELEVFKFPHIIQINHPLASDHEYFTYMKEVWRSYSLLFPVHDIAQHRGILNRIVLRSYYCWCKSCKVRRAFEKHGNGCKYASTAFLEAVSLNWESWNTDDFPILWYRIQKLRDHQVEATPATVRALWKDRRHPVQFYGILFAAVVVPFSIISIALAGATLKFAVTGPNTPPTSTPTPT